MNQERLSNIQKQLQQKGLDGMALVPGPNLLYISGMHTHLSERPIVLLIPDVGEPAIIIPTLEAPKARSAGIPEHLIFHWGDDEGYMTAFQDACQALKWIEKTIAVEKLYMRMLEWDMLEEFAFGLKRDYADPILNGLRLIKGDDELVHIEKAIAIAEQAMHDLLPQIKIGMTEKKIAGMLSQLMIEGGSEGNPFGPIVSSGPNAASPHAVPTDRPIQAGELMIIDWGAIVNDYPSDITRTFAIGDISDELKQMYDTVKAANEAGITAAHPSNSCSTVDEEPRRVIDEAGLGDYFIHRTGHGLGLEVHEEPSMITGNRSPLVPGMTFTIEPGVYIPEVGGVRVEDDILITADGNRVLTSFSKELITIGI
ncbi:MAG: Xaa-Pro dipeptidase [Cellvibrionaceae bacterium]|jgi:Xaa-Pro dipeptidase